MGEESRKNVNIYTDGACSGNPGPGGYGVVLRFGSVEKELSGGDSATTNNRMELLGVITGLSQLKESCHVTITTDSQYVIKGVTAWIPGWIRNNWPNQREKAGGEPGSLAAAGKGAFTA